LRGRPCGGDGEKRGNEEKGVSLRRKRRKSVFEVTNRRLKRGINSEGGKGNPLRKGRTGSGRGDN